MRVKSVGINYETGLSEFFVREDHGDRWRSINRRDKPQSMNNDELIDCLREAMTYQSPPTPEKRATDAYRNCFLHSKNGYSDEDCISVFAQAIREAIQADREAR